ncbi:aplysianin-A-like [Haliotis cracherodii]|uniref:aplysianin-A-like n=1 Tax=Haliotis cracherodii TaxID=6455 RepID=UPI0039ED008A
MMQGILWVTLAVTVTLATAFSDPSDGDCLDIAVIGGGIGGAYTGWRLRDRGLSISVFEYSDRVGGRLFSAELPVAPGTYLDFGGMRFRASVHTTLNRTATEIGLTIIPFKQGYGIPDETLWYTRGKRMRNTDLGTRRVPYNLDEDERKDPDILIRELLKNNVNISSSSFLGLEELYSLTTTDGTPLYKMTIDNFYGRYASREAYNYVLDTSGWAEAVGPQGALKVLKVYLPHSGGTGQSEEFQTIEGGMGRVPQTLMEKFLKASASHKLHLNHQLMRMEKRQTGGYNLRFRKTQTLDGVTTPVQASTSDVTMCARNVVLAAQKECIQEIDFPEFKNNPEIVKNLDSVLGFPAGRIWWKTGNPDNPGNPDITHSKSDLPNRQTYDWSTGTNNVSIIMASYHDGDFAHYWRELSQFGTPIPGSLPGVNAVTDVVKKRVEKYLSAIYNVSQADIPEVVGGGMMLWDKYPFSAAWSYFKPGFDERQVRDVVYKPSPSDHVYIVSNSWAADDMQGWSEGSLRAVDAVIAKYFSG